MNEEALIKGLEDEGYTKVRVCPIPPDLDMPAHTHDVHTVHIVLDGELTISEGEGERVYKPGDRVEFPANTTHKARGTGGRMIVGVKNA